MEQVAILKYQQQEEREYLIYGAVFFLADIGFLQEPAYVELPECISKFALNFGVVMFISRVYHKVGTYLRCLLIALILFKGF